MTPSEIPTPGTYRHYKGGEYRVFGVALNTTDNDLPVVMYQALYECPDLVEFYGPNPWFVRSLESFNQKVEVDGRSTPRFVRVSD